MRVDPAVNYLCTTINCAKTKFLATGSEATRLFFTCLDNKASTSEAQWLRNVKKGMIRVCFQRSMAAGEDMGNSEIPIYLDHFREMIRAYSREGSQEAALRKFALIFLWASGGRSSEVIVAK